MQIPNLLMILAGENPKTRHRTNHAIKIHNEIGSIRGARIPLYLTGSHSGLNGIFLPKGKIPYCEQMRMHALSQGVKDSNIILEIPRQRVGSLDTVANFIYALDTLQRFKDVGLFTEKYHMQRGLWLGKKVFDERVQFTSFSSEPDVITNMFGIMQERATLYSLIFDLAGIADGDYEKLQKYLEQTHPFHSLTYGNKPNFSLYGLMTKFGKLLNARSREKNEFFEN